MIGIVSGWTTLARCPHPDSHHNIQGYHVERTAAGRPGLVLIVKPIRIALDEAQLTLGRAGLASLWGYFASPYWHQDRAV